MEKPSDLGETGFTLLELLIIILIIGILSAISIPAYLRYVSKVKLCSKTFCIHQDPIETGCAVNIQTIKEKKIQRITLQQRYSPKCDTSWSRIIASPSLTSGATIYVERQGTPISQYSKYTIPHDQKDTHFSDMGPGKDLQACVEFPNGQILCTD